MGASKQRSELAVRFGRTIRRLRHERGHSQEDFADLVGVHRTYMGSVERGEKVSTLDTVDKLANGLGITLVQLFQEVQKETD
jgi:transcriptional regulator with XRE-family HTH domain